MARVFLSHSSRDNASSGRIKAWLEQQGFEAPFLDFDKHAGIPPGADWEKTLYREIERSQALLILQSTNWSASKWCFAEFTQARALGKPIFQVIESADGDAGPPIAPDLQVLDLRQEREAGLEQLKKQLEAIALSAQGGFPWDGTRPPYPGLLAFEEEDAPIYFGRDDDIRHLIERLRARRTLGGARLLVLLGASGSGKSSLLRAGVLPRLRRSGRGWLVVPPFRPQSQPCQELARALALAAGRGAHWIDLHRSLLEGDRSGTLPVVLAQVAGDLRMAAAANEALILLSIDQGEELFAGLEPEEERRFFRILTAAMGGDLPFLAVMTLRSEFLGRLQAAEKDGLTARFEEVSLAPLPMAQIPTIIKGPAQVAGLEVEEAFVQQAAADAETEDALPLLAFALREIYERYGGDHHLSLADYQALGDAQAALSPLENAVRRRADEVLTGMQPSEEQKKALRDAFVPAMVRFEQGNYVRRPARWDALPAEAQPLLERLVTARLLISRVDKEGNRLLEVAHEALLRKWPLLRGWLDEDREFLIGSQQLEADLQDWQKTGEQERPAALLSGLKLQRAKAWLSERPQQLSDELRDFVQASSDRAEEQERKARRNRRLVMGGLSGLTALAVAGGGIAWWREGAARAAQGEQYAVSHRALLTSNPLESVVNGLAAEDSLRLNPCTALHLSQTLDQAVQNNHERDAITTGQGLVNELVALPNGDLLSAGLGGSIKRWGKDGQQIGATIDTGQGRVNSLVALPNGELLSTGDDGNIKRWSMDGKALATINTGQAKVFSLVVLPNGELLSGGQDGKIQRWSKGGKALATIISGFRSVASLVALPNGELLSVQGGDNIKRWSKDGKALATINTRQTIVTSLVALPTGELFSGGVDGSIKRWSKGGKALVTIDTGQGRVNSMVSLPNGDLLSGGQNGSIKRWSKDGKALATISAGKNSVDTLVTMPSGHLLSAGDGGTIRRWSTKGKPLSTIHLEPKDSVSSLVALPNGELLSTGVNSSMIQRWSKDGKALATIHTGHLNGVGSLVSLPNGELLTGGDGGIIERRSKDGKALSNISTGQRFVSALVALPNGELASAGHDGTVKRWRKHGEALSTITTGQGMLSQLVALPNGELASAGEDGTVKRWRKDGTALSEFSTGHLSVDRLLVLPNGELISAGAPGSIKRWSKDGKALATIVTGDRYVHDIVALPNGNLLSAGDGSSIKCWSKDGKAQATISTSQGYVSSLVVLPNGDLLSGGGDGSIKRWSAEAIAKRGCFDLRDHSVLRDPQTPSQWAARDTCQRLGVIRGQDSAKIKMDGYHDNGLDSNGLA